ncbi:ankyrin repeat-containing domain protein [Hypoxylon rubiginosum]|uniref:Ankyrin repeat-containing domain protein n=1 Tax=Hypoxylon rubiginosum TaxID=110542 RepID=A0ACB9ZH81_9PEZI|nr:ankyrin repeat-containing domain protein [Hypoxylon rubiginosum]
MDPLSVIAGITGIIGFTTKAIQEVIQIISDMKDAPTEISQLKGELENLKMVLQSAQTVFHRQNFKPKDVILLHSVQQCMDSCKENVSALLSALKQIAALPFGGGKRDKALTIWRWMQRKTQIRAQQGRLREAKASLNLSITVCNGYLTGKGFTDIQEEIENMFEQHRKDFMSPNGARGFRRKLENDLRSVTTVSQPSSATGQTDGGYALKRFMDDLSEAEPPVEAPIIYSAPTEHTPLLNAVSIGDLKRVLELASTGASFLERYDNGLTILHHCALYNEPQIAAIALDHGANINSKDIQERLTPFQLAMREESWNVAELLITRGCTLGGFDDEQLLGFLRHHSGDLASPKDVIKGLNERLRNSVNGHNIVSKLVDRNDIQTLQLLLEAGFSPNEAEQKTNIMPLHRAILFKHIYCLRLLIEHGADTNAFLPPSSHQFLQRGDRCHDEIRELSLSKGITPLSLATNGDDEVNVIAMKMLLENGADPNYFFEERGSTLLTSVCAPYYWSFAKALIEAGANVNVVAKTDNTNPLYWAVRCSNLTMLTSLLDHGADPNLPSPSHCLHTAILQGSEEMAIELANRGSDLNAKDGQGKTPLQRAEQCGLLLVVEAIRILSGLST